MNLEKDNTPCGTCGSGDQSGTRVTHVDLPTVMVSPYGVGLRCLEFCIPLGAKARVLADGSIEYDPEGAPPDICGYKRDEDNPYLFHPEWLPCELRYHGMSQKGPWIDVVMVCNSPDAYSGEKVTIDQCRECPFRVPGKAK